MIEAVIFDLDGTLVQLPIDYPKMYAEFKKIMKTDQVRPLLETVAKLDTETKKQVFKAWDKAELAITEKITPNPEGMDLYQKHADKAKALVTMQGKPVVKVIVDQFKLGFDFVATREDSLSRAEQLKIAAEKLKTPLGSILFVGNADSDTAAAESVGCQFFRVK